MKIDNKDTLVQISDYLLLKKKTTRMISNYKPITNAKQAKKVLNEMKSLALQQPNQTLMTQASNRLLDVFYLLS